MAPCVQSKHLFAIYCSGTQPMHFYYGVCEGVTVGPHSKVLGVFKGVPKFKQTQKPLCNLSYSTKVL